MAQRFVACDREQSFLMPPDVREWLPPRHLAWFVIDAVGEMNLEAFYAAYRVEGRSWPAYDPAMMVAVLLYAYARGVRSSRVIERACEEDVAFRVLAAQQRPDLSGARSDEGWAAVRWPAEALHAADHAGRPDQR
jgi:transposase